MSLKKLQDRKAALVRDMKAMLAAADKDSRDLTADELLAYGKNESELGVKAADGNPATGLEAEIARAERLAAYEKELSVVTPPSAAPEAEGGAKKIRIEGLRVKSRNFKNDEDAYLSGRFVRAMWLGKQEDKDFLAQHGVQMLAATGSHSSMNNATGGVFVPDVLAQTIIDLRLQYGVYRRNTRVVPMTSDTLTINRRVSGLTVYYPAENSDITASKTAWNQVSLTAKKYACLAVYPMELAADAVISLADMLAEESAYAFAKAEDTNGFLGDGTTTYGNTVGIVTKINDGSHDGSLYAAASGHTGFETLSLGDFHGLTAKLPSYARTGAKFYISPTGFDSCMSRLMYGSGGVTVEQVAGGVQYRFLGYPVELSEVLNSTAGADASKVKCLFGNLGQASTMGDRMGISIATDGSRYFEADQVAFKATQRVDIVNHDCGTATVAGPVVALKTPGS